jgi:outer membrane protein assembly factor BamD
LLILSLGFISSCASKDEKTSSEGDYVKALKELKDRDFNAAAESFKKIGDDYPLSQWGVKAQTMAAYAFYKGGKLDEVISTSTDFIGNNPSSPDISYMYYLKSVAYYDQMNDIQRAQDHANLASYSFRELIARFPNSKYSRDARTKLILVDDHIAGAKMSVGRFQLESRNYVGAIKNFQTVKARYSRTNQTPEAYFRLYEAYQTIGLTSEARKYQSELKKYYPESFWAKN